MTTATRTIRTLVASTTTSGGATSSTLDLTTALGAGIVVRVGIGSTPPSVAPTVTFNVSKDGTNWRQFKTWTPNGNAASTNYDHVEVIRDFAYVQVVFPATDQAITIEATAHELTTLTEQPAPFTPIPGSTTALAVSTSSNNVAVPSGASSVRIYTPPGVQAYLTWGTSNSITATTSNMPLMSGSAETFGVPAGYTYLAAITASGSGSLAITGGAGG